MVNQVVFALRHFKKKNKKQHSFLPDRVFIYMYPMEFDVDSTESDELCYHFENGYLENGKF